MTFSPSQSHVTVPLTGLQVVSVKAGAFTVSSVPVFARSIPG